MGKEAPIEVTTRYATSVDTLTEAWTFVMARVDRVGPEPSIKITPVTSYAWHDMGNDDAEPRRFFEVVVSGMVHEEDETQ